MNDFQENENNEFENEDFANVYIDIDNFDETLGPEESNGVSEDTDVKTEEPKKPFSDILDWTSCFVFAVAAVLALNLFVFRSITVSGDSMNNTLIDKDRVIATNFTYTPDYGDIVIVEADKLHLHGTAIYGETIIKRVIAKAGDTIRVDFENGVVYLNGEELQEDYIKEKINTHYPGWIESNRDYVVPENCVFVMGDNRNHSNDSRNISEVGFIDTNYIMGKAFVRYAPIKNFKWL